jgi:hypothetical protein
MIYALLTLLALTTVAVVRSLITHALRIPDARQTTFGPRTDWRAF